MKNDTLNTQLLKAKHEALPKNGVPAICNELGITRATYYNTIAGKNVKLETLSRICKALDVNLSDALTPTHR